MKNIIMSLMVVLFISKTYSSKLLNENFIYKNKVIEYSYNVDKSTFFNVFLKSQASSEEFIKSVKECYKQKIIKSNNFFLIIPTAFKESEDELVLFFLNHIINKYKFLDKQMNIFTDDSSYINLYDVTRNSNAKLKTSSLKKRRELAVEKKKSNNLEKIKKISLELEQLKKKQDRSEYYNSNLNSINNSIELNNKIKVCDLL